MRPLAAAYLERACKPGHSDVPLYAMPDDTDGWRTALDEMPDAFGEAADAVIEQTKGSAASLLQGSFASAACDSHGSLIVADPSFLQWLHGPDPLSAVVKGITADRPAVTMIADDATGRPIAIAAGRRAVVDNWPLDPVVRKALSDGTAAYAAIAFQPNSTSWERAAAAYGFTRSELRLVQALAQTGDLKKACISVVTSYETGRKLVAQAMIKTGAPRQTDLIRQVVGLVAGDLAAPDGVSGIFADLFELSIPQAQLARAVALGATRDQAAKTLRISVHTVKAEMKVIFSACGVNSAGDLARIVAEVDVLAGMATACDIEIDLGDTLIEPLRLIQRRDGNGKIAVVDHGPPSGVPVVIFHSITNARTTSPKFVAALREAGFRPIVFERAGFGLSDPVEGQPYLTATRDFEDVLDALKIPRALLIARGGKLAALNVAAALPERVIGGVLINPGAATMFNRAKTGMFGLAAKILAEHPKLVNRVAKASLRRTSADAVEYMMRTSVKNCALDLKALDDPREMKAIARSNLQCARGVEGVIAESLEDWSDICPAHVPTNGQWAVIIGELDHVYTFDQSTVRFWRGHLPDADIVTIPDGGRFLHITHSDAIIAALQNQIAKSRR